MTLVQVGSRLGGMLAWIISFPLLSMLAVFQAVTEFIPSVYAPYREGICHWLSHSTQFHTCIILFTRMFLVSLLYTDQFKICSADRPPTSLPYFSPVYLSHINKLYNIYFISSLFFSLSVNAVRRGNFLCFLHPHIPSA